MTIVGAFLYIAVVFTFVIGGNREDERLMKLESEQQAAAESAQGQPQ